MYESQNVILVESECDFVLEQSPGFDFGKVGV